MIKAPIIMVTGLNMGIKDFKACKKVYLQGGGNGLKS